MGNESFLDEQGQFIVYRKSHRQTDKSTKSTFMSSNFRFLLTSAANQSPLNLRSSKVRVADSEAKDFEILRHSTSQLQ